MATTSSLLRSALARRKEVSALEDKLADFEWQSSAKTQDDWQAYVDHLSKRIDQNANDLSSQLTYQTKVRSANRSYTSAEIQRQQINILEGNGSLQSKQQAIQELYGLAVDNQDYDLAQNLRQQFDNINIQVQNQAARGQALAAKMAETQSLSVKEHINKLIYGSATTSGQYDPSINSIARLRNEFGANGDEALNDYLAGQYPIPHKTVGFWDVAIARFDEIANTYLTAIQQLQGTGKEYALIADYNKFIGQTADGSVSRYEVAPGLSMSYQEVVQAAQAQAAGNDMYEPVQQTVVRDGKAVSETTFKRKVTGNYVWGLDENGNYAIMPVYERMAHNTSDFKYDVGKGKESFTDALKRLGVSYVDNGDNQYTIYAALGLPGQTNQEGIQVIVTPDGSIRAVVADQQGNSNLYGLQLSEAGIRATQVDKPIPVTDSTDIETTKLLLGQGDTSQLLDPYKAFEFSQLVGGTGNDISKLLGIAQYQQQQKAAAAEAELQARAQAALKPIQFTQLPQANEAVKAPTVAEANAALSLPSFRQNVFDQATPVPYMPLSQLIKQNTGVQPTAPTTPTQATKPTSVSDYTKSLTSGVFGGL